MEIFSFDLSKKLTKVFKGKINREIEKCCNESKENIVVSGKESCGIIVDVNSVSILKEDATEIRRNIPIRRDYETIWMCKKCWQHFENEEEAEQCKCLE